MEDAENLLAVLIYLMCRPPNRWDLNRNGIHIVILGSLNNKWCWVIMPWSPRFLSWLFFYSFILKIKTITSKNTVSKLIEPTVYWINQYNIVPYSNLVHWSLFTKGVKMRLMSELLILIMIPLYDWIHSLQGEFELSLWGLILPCGDTGCPRKKHPGMMIFQYS